MTPADSTTSPAHFTELLHYRIRFTLARSRWQLRGLLALVLLFIPALALLQRATPGRMNLSNLLGGDVLVAATTLLLLIALLVPLSRLELGSGDGGGSSEPLLAPAWPPWQRYLTHALVDLAPLVALWLALGLEVLFVRFRLSPAGAVAQAGDPSRMVELYVAAWLVVLLYLVAVRLLRHCLVIYLPGGTARLLAFIPAAFYLLPATPLTRLHQRLFFTYTPGGPAPAGPDFGYFALIPDLLLISAVPLILVLQPRLGRARAAVLKWSAVLLTAVVLLSGAAVGWRAAADPDTGLRGSLGTLSGYPATVLNSALSLHLPYLALGRVVQENRSGNREWVRTLSPAFAGDVEDDELILPEYIPIKLHELMILLVLLWLPALAITAESGHYNHCYGRPLWE